MAIDNQNIQDPTTQGVRGLRGLEGINRLRNRGINIDASILTLAKDYKGTMAEINQATSPRQNIGFVGVGDSMYDEEITSATQLDNLANTRGELQPWYAQIGAGLTKGAILAGTTFLDGTVGLVLGAGKAVKEGRFSALWDNDFSKAMQSVNEWSEQALPNYYTDAERNKPWENIFTANFLGDKLIKNFGFAIGAFYSGGVTAAGLKATKLPQIIGAVAKSSKAPAIITSGVGATISAVNEGRIEALNNSTDWFELQKAQLDDQHNARLQALEQYRGTEMYYSLIAQENANYEAAIGKLNEDRLKMGNADLLMNIPILMASNLIQFGRLYANGYKTARKATNIVGKVGEYATEKTVSKGIAKSLLSPLSEGTEELAQKAASVVSGVHYEDDVNNFYKAKIDPEAEQETLSWIKSFAEGINQTVNDGSSWEEFFIGTLIGALGMPRFRGIRSSEGNLQSPVTFEGGTLGEYREYRDQMNRETEIANYMNNRVSSPEFVNYYQGLIRHNKYQRDMNQAVENKDEFEFKNAEHAQLISDITMFDNAGKLEDLVTLVNSAFDTSDENLASIVENTTSSLEDGSKVGPFVDKNGNPMYSTPEGRQEMIDKLTQTKDEMLSAITNYTKIKDDIDIRTGQQLNDEQLQELTWLKSQITNWKDRANQLSKEVKPTIGTILGSMSQLADIYSSVKAEEGKNNAGLTDLYRDADNKEGKLRKSMSSLETLRSLDDRAFAYLLSKDSKLVGGIKDMLNDPLSGVSADEIQSIETKLDDIVKLVDATDRFNIKLKEYLENPSKLEEDIVTAKDEIIKEENKKKSDTLRDKLLSTTTLSEFKQTLDNEESVGIKMDTLKSLIDEGNTIAKDYDDVNTYINNAKAELHKLSSNNDTYNDALTLLNKQAEIANNVSDLVNINTSVLTDENIFLDESNGDIDLASNRFHNALHLLLRAMYEVNNNDTFKNRFSKSIAKPEDIIENMDPDKGISNETTGDSGTPTVPVVTPENTPRAEKEISSESAVGDTSHADIVRENANYNKSNNPSRLEGSNKYYRPAIPEIHIEASRKGDFRPFNEVITSDGGFYEYYSKLNSEEKKLVVATITSGKPRTIDTIKEAVNKDNDFHRNLYNQYKDYSANFDDIYNYLKNNGAFSYVNEGKLERGAPIGFMIDPEFEELVKDKEWHKNPTIFIIDKSNNQVVGVLDEGASVDRFEGLSSLEEKIRQEYSSRERVANLEDAIYITKTVEGYTPLTKLQDWSKKTGDVRTNPDGVGTHNGLTYYKIKAGYRGGDNITVWFRNTPSQRVLSKVEGILEVAKEDKHDLIEAGNLILDEINKETSREKFIATPTTRVSKIMIGKIPIGSEERSLSVIPNVSSEFITPVFGIVKNGTLSTNSTLSANEIISPLDISGKEGRLYLMIPNAAGTYSPAAVRVKLFNENEFNLNDINTVNTPVGKNIKSALTSLAEARTQEDISKAIESLGKFLYFRDVMVTYFEKDAGEGIVISKKVKRGDGSYETVIINGKEQIREEKHTIYFSKVEPVDYGGMIVYGLKNIKSIPGYEDYSGIPKSTTEMFDEILAVLNKFNLPLQVDLKSINKGNYNTILINSGILTSNITDAKVIGSWFTTDYFDNEGNLHSAVNPVSKVPTQTIPNTTSNNNPVGGKEVINGISTTIDNRTLYVDNSFKTIYDDNGVNITSTLDNRTKDRYLATAFANERYGTATEGVNMHNNVYITPSGRVFDRNTNDYIEGEEAQKIKDIINGVKKEEPKELDLPLFNTSLDSLVKVDRTEKESEFSKEDTIGYFELDGVVHKGHLKYVGDIGGHKIHIAKIRSKGYGNSYNNTSIYVPVFPNGKAVNTNTNSSEDQKAIDAIMEVLNGNIDRVNKESNSETSITKAINKEQSTTSNNSVSKQEIKSSLQGKMNAINNFDDNDTGILRKTTDSSYNLWDREKELSWLKSVLPQISESERLQIVEGLIKVAESGITAWGKFHNGIVTLSDIAAEGTTYHEAYHVVFNLLLDNNERESLLNEYRSKYPSKDYLDLEEQMAEDFREFVMQGGKDTRSFSRKVLDFFKSLFTKITHWKALTPSSMYYFKKINDGKYAKEALSNNKVSRNNIEDYRLVSSRKVTSFDSYDSNIQEVLINKGWTKELFNSISQEERDNALNCIAF